MRKQMVLFWVVAVLTACSNAQLPSNTQPSISPEYVWNKVLDEGPWPKSYNFQMFVTDQRIHIFHQDGTWQSSDAKTWSKTSLTNAINNHAFLDYVQFKNAVYGLGFFNGNNEQFTFRPEIFRTGDLRQWESIAKNSNLPKRYFYKPFIFRDKIWIIGGESKNTKFSDIWNSTDGIKWIKQRDRTALGKRSNSQIVELNGVLYLLNNDVWSSKDGLEWKLETSEIVKGEEIFGYAAVVYDGKIWLLGCNRNGRFESEILVSDDGKTWLTQRAPWSPRGGVAAVVFNDKIYMTGGKYGGTPDQVEFIYSNDLWALGKE